ncbi:hypothetical protein [Curtobacterium sp. MCBD17_040]|nr:hypothetical protein [Curtobacterium sp. MCBD17_040]WIB65790.1 hypothetical protein DEI94_16885 [Curtobacterium sp. MCBD17_040]
MTVLEQLGRKQARPERIKYFLDSIEWEEPVPSSSCNEHWLVDC